MDNPVPWIRSGKGNRPQDGGCIMQIIDWITEATWTDMPVCVAGHVRWAAIYVNDLVADETRQRLLDLIPKMMGTRKAFLTDEQDMALENANDKFRNQAETLGGGWDSGERLMDVFEEFLDEYNAVIGRTPERAADLDAELAAVCELTWVA